MATIKLTPELKNELYLYHCAGGHTRAAMAQGALEKAGFAFDPKGRDGRGSIYWPDGVELVYEGGNIVYREGWEGKSPEAIRAESLAYIEKRYPVGSPIVGTFKTGRSVRTKVATFYADGNGNGWVRPESGESIRVLPKEQADTIPEPTPRGPKAKAAALHLPSCSALRRDTSPERVLTDADCSCGAVEGYEKEHARRGVMLAEVLGLKLKRNGRYNTSWGDKTPYGLYSTAFRILSEGK